MTKETKIFGVQIELELCGKTNLRESKCHKLEKWIGQVSFSITLQTYFERSSTFITIY